MTRTRSLVWLIALVAFVVPSFGAAAASHAMAPSMTHEAQMAAVECPDHAPPPADCPAQGTAQHAAGQCCPMMTGVVAVLPPTSVGVAPAPLHDWLAAPVRSLAGLTFTQDPPPPRV
ncbi:MAG: hypothetical protein Q8M19_21310 [Reyranella sp.]|nr:hypothetical protein [Reyranella sp.]